MIFWPLIHTEFHNSLKNQTIAKTDVAPSRRQTLQTHLRKHLPDSGHDTFPPASRTYVEKTDADFSTSVFLVEQIINLSNQFTNDFARVIDFSYEISAL